MLQVAERKLAIPTRYGWTLVGVPGIEASNYDNFRIKEPAHTLYIFDLPARWEDGNIALMQQGEVAPFLRDYNLSTPMAYGSAYGPLRFTALRDDNETRKKLDTGRDCHAVWLNYLTRPHDSLRPVDGIGQQLVHRILYLYGTDGELHEICPVTIAPSGMVPLLSKNGLEKWIGAEGLERLERLRGRDIYEKGEDVVDVNDAFGNPQITFDHDEKDGFGLIPHSHHVYTPNQDEPERVGIRSARWAHHGGRRCFLVDLDVRAVSSGPRRSVPLVRGDPTRLYVGKEIVY